MNFRVVLSERAESDRDAAFQWYVEHYDSEFAARWYNHLHETLETLSYQPERCVIAREDKLFPFQVREKLCGINRKNHRVLFTLHKEVVVVLHIRHTAQKDLSEEDY